MARERMQDNDEEKLQNTGEDDKIDLSSATLFGRGLPRYLACFLPCYLS